MTHGRVPPRLPTLSLPSRHLSAAAAHGKVALLPPLVVVVVVVVVGVVGVVVVGVVVVKTP